MRSLALLVLPSLFATALSAADAACLLGGAGEPAGKLLRNSLLQSRSSVRRLQSSFVPRPHPEAFEDLAPGQRRRLNTSDLVQLPLSLPGIGRDLSVFGYPAEEDEYVSGSVLLYGSWEGEGVAQIRTVFEQHPSEGLNFLDVGGNIGTIALPVAALLERRGGRVFAVEAMPSIGEHLKAGIVENGLRNVALYSYAVSSPVAADDLVMALHPTNKGGSAVVGNEAWTTSDARTARVPLTTLDAMLDQEPGLRRVLVAKMDIEGNEGRALQGAKRLLREAPPCYLMIELNVEWLQNAGTPIEGVSRLLEDAGYDTTQISPTKSDETYRLQQVDMKGCLARLGVAGGPVASA